MPESAGFHFKIQKNFLISELENSISWNRSNLLRVEFFGVLALGLESTSDHTKQANKNLILSLVPYLKCSWTSLSEYAIV